MTLRRMPDTLGQYEILSTLGRGGMGEVFLARDTVLKREVALKVLPEVFSRDPERSARFRREAEVLASLNHPGIAQVYGFVDAGGRWAIAMEHVAGPALACPLPIDTALDYTRQIIDALEYAHDRGIVHRDLKPANVKISADGAVKLLDFGLAKAVEDPASTLDPNLSPTITLGHTTAGQILGTPAYMAPEQISGKPADRRSDIFAFGALLYEMLTGARAFDGTSVEDTLASVLKLDPDWSKLPTDVPAGVRALLARCLHKDRRLRLQAIGEARIALASLGLESKPTAVAARSRFRYGWPAAAVVSLAALLGVGAIHYTEAPARSRSTDSPFRCPRTRRPMGWRSRPTGDSSP
jgi:serine/threonine protein kinase